MVSASSGVGLSHILKELITETSGEGLVIENIPEECIGIEYLSEFWKIREIFITDVKRLCLRPKRILM